MEVQITKFFNGACPRDYSASVMEIGQDAGPSTWRAAMDDAEDYNHITNDNVEEWCKYVRGSGGWTAEEVAAFSMQELNALFIQWVSGDIREKGDDSWEKYEKDSENGQNNGSLFFLEGEVYWMGE